MYRMRKGTYRIVGSTGTATLFKTSVGEFRLDSKHNRLQVKTGKSGWSGIEASEIREIVLKRSEEPAWFWEIISGFNIWDFSGRYRDQNILLQIDAVRNDGSYVTLYEASQLEEHEFWIWGWWVRVVRKILRFTKLVTDAESHTEEVYADLKNEFRKVGVAV